MRYGSDAVETLKKISTKGHRTLNTIEEMQFRGDQRARVSLNQGGVFACYKDEFSL